MLAMWDVGGSRGYGSCIITSVLYRIGDGARGRGRNDIGQIRRSRDKGELKGRRQLGQQGKETDERLVVLSSVDSCHGQCQDCMSSKSEWERFAV
jgi:hypothetical protein